jgi:hypothetical protein
MILKTQNVADMKRTPLSSIVTLATLLLPLVSAIDAECSACEAVAVSFELRVDGSCICNKSAVGVAKTVPT